MGSDNVAAMPDNSAEVEDVAKLLEISADRIDDLEGQLHLANAQLEVMVFVRTLIGIRGGPMGPTGVDMAQTFTDSIRNRAKSMRRVAGRR